MKKVLVTGGTGFVGAPVVAELLARGYEVCVVSSKKAQTIQAQTSGTLTTCQLDLMDFSGVRTFLQQNRFDGIIHMAWLSATGAHAHNSDGNLNWTMAGLNLLQCYVEQGGRKFLGAGTMSEYDFAHGYLREDATPLTSKFLYGQCKSSLYNIGAAYCKLHDVDFKWGRIFNLYGPHEKEARLIPAVITACLRGEDVKVSDCIKFQDYLHVFDAAKGMVDLFESSATGAVNICSGAPVRLRTIVEKIVELIGFKGKVLWGAIPSYFDELVVVGDNKRLIEAVGWKQQIELNNGLQMTIDWWKESGRV